MKNFLKMALALLPLAVMSSCAADDPIIDDSDGIAKKSETRYLQVTLSSANGAPGTRNPGDLPDTDGTEGFQPYNPDDETQKLENKIKTLDFYFYDRYKQFHSHVSMPIAGNVADVDKDGALDPDGISSEDNVAAFYHCNVPVELVQGETLPNYVICIVNAVEANQYETKSMAEAQASIISKLYSTQTGNKGELYFGMSNSVYYGVDEVTGNENELIMATPFDFNKLRKKSELESWQATVNSSTATQDDKEAAQQEIEASTINIYVERYAVKVMLDISTTQYTPYPAAGYSLEENAVPYSLKFHATGWNVNATEKSFFFLKAFREPNTEYNPNIDSDWTHSYIDTYATKSGLDKLLFTGWNENNEHRSYWSRTPGYYVNSYPVVADDVTYATPPEQLNSGEATDGGQFIVDYWSYNQSLPITNKDVKQVKHVNESTMNYTRLTGEGMPDQYMPLASIPSVILTGYYTLNDNNEAVDFYLYGKDSKGNERIYAGADNIEGVSHIKDKMLQDQSVIMTRSASSGTGIGGTTVYDYTPISNTASVNIKNLFDVSHPSQSVRRITVSSNVGESVNSEIKVASDIVVLQVKTIPSAEQNLWFYNTQVNAYQQIDETNVDLVNRLLLQNLGGAHYYKKGMAFFSAPIFHWGWYRADNTNRTSRGDDGKPLSVDEWDWKAMKTGDFGLVRNHIYEMKIGNISGLGTAIKDESDPIVPPAEKLGYAVHFHVNIQKWAVLPVQTWDF